MAVEVVGATNDRADSWPVRAYLREMLVLRAAEAAGVIALVAYQIVATHEHFSVPILVTAVLLFYISTWIIYLHLQSGRPLSDIQMTGHLMVDVVVLGLLLFTASGTTNPFAILYLPLVVVAAATLRDLLLSIVVLACVGSYGLLMLYHHEWWVDEMNPDHRAVEVGTWMALSMVVVLHRRVRQPAEPDRARAAEARTDRLREEPPGRGADQPRLAGRRHRARTEYPAFDHGRGGRRDALRGEPDSGLPASRSACSQGRSRPAASR